VQCASNANCSGATPVCNTTTHQRLRCTHASLPDSRSPGRRMHAVLLHQHDAVPFWGPRVRLPVGHLHRLPEQRQLRRKLAHLQPGDEHVPRVPGQRRLRQLQRRPRVRDGRHAPGPMRRVPSRRRLSGDPSALRPGDQHMRRLRHERRLLGQHANLQRRHRNVSAVLERLAVRRGRLAGDCPPAVRDDGVDGGELCPVHGAERISMRGRVGDPGLRGDHGPLRLHAECGLRLG
jgi:hypothetical protein